MENYVLCSRDGATNRLFYYTGTNSVYGGSQYGDVLEAKRFDSLESVAALLAKNPGEFYLGINIILISDATFKALENSHNGDRALYLKYHDPNYAIR